MSLALLYLFFPSSHLASCGAVLILFSVAILPVRAVSMETAPFAYERIFFRSGEGAQIMSSVTVIGAKV